MATFKGNPSFLAQDHPKPWRWLAESWHDFRGQGKSSLSAVESN